MARTPEEILADVTQTIQAFEAELGTLEAERKSILMRALNEAEEEQIRLIKTKLHIQTP